MRAAALRALDYGPRWAVRAAFDLSHRRLDEPVARLFGLLAAVPGTDIGLAVAAVVADRPEGEVRAGLRALCRKHLSSNTNPSLDNHRGGGCTT